MARHCEAAGLTDEAITHYQRAGEGTQARSAHEEAIAQFRKAIALLETRPAGDERNERELTLHLALGASLIAVRGWSHAETGAAYERAAALAETGGDAVRRGMARTGLGLYDVNRGELARGRALLSEVLAAAEARGDSQQTFFGHATLAVAELYLAKFASSLAHCERALVLYDSVQHQGLAQVFGPDPAVSTHDHAALDLWFLGHSDAALARAQEAVAIARRVPHPFSLAFALFFESNMHCYRRDHGPQLERATEVIALSEAQGFPLYVGLGRAYHAMARVMNGDPGALAEIMDGLALAAGTGSQIGAPGFMFFLAEAQQCADQLAAAQGTVAAGLAVAAQTGQPAWDADLHRLDGELLLARGGVADEAAARYTRALAIAREYGARSPELRVATSLARLWQQQGKRAEARDLLGPVYAWFTEGFETRDLKEAKALLAEL